FDSTTDGRAVKIASMVDEHTRESLLHLAERSITAQRLVVELERVFAAVGGPPKVLRMDNGPELISDALQQFCTDRVGIIYIPPGTPWNNGFIESFNRRLRNECLNRNHWTSLLEARVVIGDFKTDHNQRHRHSALGYLTPAEYAARCDHTHHGWDPLIGSIGCESSDAPEWVQEETITPCHDVGIPLSRSFASCVRASGCSVSSSVLRMCVSTSRSPRRPGIAGRTSTAA